jgi:hypothetical protein
MGYLYILSLNSGNCWAKAQPTKGQYHVGWALAQHPLNVKTLGGSITEI